MENNENKFNLFKDRILKYNAVAQVLHESPNIEEERDMLVKAMDAESEILKSFGLPETTENRGMLDLFCWAGDFEDADIEKFRRQLITTAENYLSPPAKGDIAFLLESKEKHLIAHDVLPVIGIDTIVYNVFLYESLFYSQDYPADVIFEEMKKGNTIPGDLVRNMNTPMLLKGALDHEISGVGLKFWNEFKENQRTERRNIPKRFIQSLDHSREEWPEAFPDIFSFTEGYVSCVCLMNTNEPSVCVEIATFFDSKWLDINVFMPFEEVLTMLKKSAGKSNASMLRNMLFERLDGNPFVSNELPVREWYKTYQFCKSLDWTVTKMELEEDDNGTVIEHHNNYALIQY